MMPEYKKLKIGTKVMTPKGRGIIRRNEKHSLRQGVRLDKAELLPLQWFFPDVIHDLKEFRDLMRG